MNRTALPQKKCNIVDCDRPQETKGFCSMHYSRLKRHGDPFKTKHIQTCTIEGCNNKHVANGFCTKHYLKYKKYGDPNHGKTVETHGETNTRLYTLWCDVKKRCLNKNAKHYDRYGGRGIQMYKQWAGSYLSFKEYIIKHLGEPPEGLTLGRIDNNKGYEPGNVRWETHATQSRNRRSNIILSYKGKAKTATDWALEFNIKIPTFFSRLRMGWTVDKIIETPINVPGKNFRVVK